MKAETIIVIFFCLAVIGIVTAIIIQGYENGNNINECKNNCELKNMTFKEYITGNHRNDVCNCINEKGGIETIYSR